MSIVLKIKLVSKSGNIKNVTKMLIVLKPQLVSKSGNIKNVTKMLIVLKPLIHLFKVHDILYTKIQPNKRNLEGKSIIITRVNIH